MTAYPLPTGQQITGALSVRFGQQLRTGRWVEQPAAKYECLLCERTETVIGAEAVTRFTQTIRTTHRATCPGHPIEQGAQAA
ncbi:hypothetical protein [Streptomyces sp. BE230]|uniref:hypothetical protein n=1 Tax=Streptomyces sp. BE230 TaxID=3002526 RepID=UPI002ED31758|nr:hypothetical protein [Streptomyces sp. BE230]